MRVTPPQDVVRLMSALARHVDQVLVRSAARNAEVSVRSRRTRHLDDARTLRDLEKIPARAAFEEQRRPG